MKGELRSAGIVGTGSCAPARVLSSADLENMVDTTDEWIRARTAIHERRIADDDTATSDLAPAAAWPALARTDEDPRELETIIDAAARRFSIPSDRFVWNLDRYDSTSAPSMPIVLDEAVRGGRVRRGCEVLLSSFGGGLSWASMVLSW